MQYLACFHAQILPLFLPMTVQNQTFPSPKIDQTITEVTAYEESSSKFWLIYSKCYFIHAQHNVMKACLFSKQAKERKLGNNYFECYSFFPAEPELKLPLYILN